jgi:hypothetical protein
MIESDNNSDWLLLELTCDVLGLVGKREFHNGTSNTRPRYTQMHQPKISNFFL